MNKKSFSKILWSAFILLQLYGCRNHLPEPVILINLPGIENVLIDGDPEEWESIESYRLWADPLGRYPAPSDLESYFKASWDKNNLLLLFEVYDDSFTSDTINPWNGDAIEVFLSEYRGSENIFQLSVIPFGSEDFIMINDRNTDTVQGLFSKEIKSSTQIYGNKRITEIQIPFYRKKEWNQSFALQLYIDDSDYDNSRKNQLVWYPVGQSYNTSFSMFPIQISEVKESIPKGSSRLVITDNEKISLYVFGATSGDNIGVYRNGKYLTSYKAFSKSKAEPDTFDITSLGWDTENDSLFITINNAGLCQHELFLSPRLYVKSSEKRFDRDIRNFMLKDRMSFPPENGTLFIGSSSIVRWETLKQDFKEIHVIQRGFGGSTSPEALMYINQIVLPYKPLKIVYYEGDNDIPMGLSPEEIRDNVESFVLLVTGALPETRIYLLSPKPSIKRMHLWEKYIKTQQLLIELANEYEYVEYVDVSSLMFDKKGMLNHSLFVEDGIHMNKEGYAIWTKALRKALVLE